MEFEDRPEWGIRETERLTLWQTPEITASVHFQEIDPGNVMPFFHLYVTDDTWTVPLFRHCQRKWREWLPTWSHFPLFTMADHDGLYGGALDRLREHFGFQLLRSIPCTDGQIRRLYVHYGPQAK